MGGLGPGIGGLEYLVIAAAALIVVGPERLPGMLRQLGKWVAKMRGMANEFRASFDEMARQSELDELRKEVEALRTGQGVVGQGMVRLGDEANAAFKDIKGELEKTDARDVPPPPVALDQPEFPEPRMTPLPSPESMPSPEPVPAPSKPRKPRKAATTETASEPAAGRKTAASAKAGPATVKSPRAPRKPRALS